MVYLASGEGKSSAERELERRMGIGGTRDRRSKMGELVVVVHKCRWAKGAVRFHVFVSRGCILSV